MKAVLVQCLTCCKHLGYAYGPTVTEARAEAEQMINDHCEEVHR